MIDANKFFGDVERNKVPIWNKYALTIDEAVKYFGIGEKKLRSMVNADDVPPSWALLNGSKVLIKREKFSKYLDEVEVI